MDRGFLTASQNEHQYLNMWTFNFTSYYQPQQEKQLFSTFERGIPVLTIFQIKDTIELLLLLSDLPGQYFLQTYVTSENGVMNDESSKSGHKLFFSMCVFSAGNKYVAGY